MGLAAIQIVMFSGTYLIALLLIVALERFLPLNGNAPGRYQHLDGVRGIAALTVVAAHVNQHLLSFLSVTTLPEHGNRAAIVAVQMFFALTAFLFTDRALRHTLEIEAFYIGRVRRIVPLYLCACMVSIPLALFYSPHGIVNPSQFLVEVVDIFAFGFLGAPTLTLQGFNALAVIGVAWTLNFEWKFYLLLPVLMTIRRVSRIAAILGGLSVAALAIRDFYTIHEVIWPFFSAGILAAVAKRYVPSVSPRLKPPITILGFALLVFSIWLPGYFSFSHLVISTLLFACILYGEPRILTVRPLRNLGLISYSIYLLQYLVLLPVVNESWQRNIRSFRPEWKFVIAFLVVTILIPLSCITYRFIELRWMSSGPSREGVPDYLQTEVRAIFESNPSTSAESDFLKLGRIVTATETGGPLQLVLPSGHRIEVGCGFDSHTLQRLIHTVGHVASMDKAKKHSRS
jgi:peptidoglycan/LPS O-acetylase OafA/YrhL